MFILVFFPIGSLVPGEVFVDNTFIKSGNIFPENGSYISSSSA